MSTPPRPDAPADPAQAEFDENAKKGWNFFTKFLLGNVIATAAALIFIGLLTVWS